MKPELKIIADHLRSSSFLIADGVLPSNEGRGYVLRRIMRRAMRQLHKLGAREATMYKFVDGLIKEMGAAYPELVRARAVIIETLKTEEEKFHETLEKGLGILEEEVSKTKNKKFSGEIAFKLYDTYGFPLDLTQDILKERNLDLDLPVFESEMEKQRERARKNWAGSGEIAEEKIFFELKEKFGETKFLGYETLSAKAKILAVYPNFLILDQTPFYATSGGQKGDDGVIAGVKISETKKFVGGLFGHFFFDQKCELKAGDEVLAKVNPQTRSARASNHSATHLMHKALKEILGDSLSQKGSNVDVDSFTFDFNFNRAVSVEELLKIEDLVNLWVRENFLVNTNLMPLDKARDSGAEALFGEKYDAEVRVVLMGKSVELCGGTHVKSTGEIGIFKIISENGIAAGIRRITAKTGHAVIKFLREEKKKSQAFEENLQQELKKKDKEIERLKKQILLASLDKIKSEKIGEVNLFSHTFEDIEAKDLREIVNSMKDKASAVFVFFACKDEKVSACVAVSADLVSKFDATKLIQPIVETIGGKGGGGKKDFAMGGGVKKEGIEDALRMVSVTLRQSS